MEKYYFRLSFFFFTICLISLSSCKDDDDDVRPKNRSEFLANGAWKLSAQTIDPAYDWDGDGTKETNLLPLGDACDNDDVLIFKSDKTVSIEEGATKCDPNDPQVIATGTWALLNNDNQLNITATGSSTPIFEWNIVELNASTFKYTETFIEDSVNYTVTFTYVH